MMDAAVSMFPVPTNDEGLAARPCLATPRKGHVLSTVAESYGGPIRMAVGVLARSLARQNITQHYQDLYHARWSETVSTIVRPSSELAAWSIVANWLVAVASRALSPEGKLSEAEAWFVGDESLPSLSEQASVRSRTIAEAALRDIAEPAALAELLPYILDPHGPGSRLSVRSRPETRTARVRKRAEGVFYTPADVASYMAREVIQTLGGASSTLTILDPACGTGVFLRAALRELQQRSSHNDTFELACSALYGIDIDPWALDATAFVLLHDCYESLVRRGISPRAAWHALRLNLACADTLLVDPARGTSEKLTRRHTYKTALMSGHVPPLTLDPPQKGRTPLDVLFPELANGPHLVIGNPPYATIGSRNDILELMQRFVTLPTRLQARTDVYPLFLEQMTRLASPVAHGGALVLPLSVACNSGSQFVALRTLISRMPGAWRFAFFDREPHALFGEDVKTRNAIVLWTHVPGEEETTIRTGPLRKWRGESRAAMFKNISFTAVSSDIRPGIPKLASPTQATVLQKLSLEQTTLKVRVSHIGRALLSEAIRSPGPAVYVGATAYNFINVFPTLHKQLVVRPSDLSEHPLYAIRCASSDDALRTYAILSSRLAFWWWHVHGDGFHVSGRHLADFPVGKAFDEASIASSLAHAGSQLWQKLSCQPLQSTNKGRVSLAFNPAVAGELRSDIDRTLLEALGVPTNFSHELDRFVERNTMATPLDELTLLEGKVGK